MQTAGLNQHQELADQQGHMQQYAIDSQAQARQNSDYIALYAQHQQQQFQQAQQSRLFDQQQGLEDTRQEGRDSRSQARRDSAEHLLQMRLTAPEERRLAQYQQQQAALDDRLASGNLTMDEHGRMSQQIMAGSAPLQNRSRMYQRGLDLQSQQDIERNARQAGAVAQLGFHASVIRDPQSGAALTDPNGSPMYLDRNGQPKPLYTPPIDAQHLAQMYSQVAQDLVRTEGVPAAAGRPATTRQIQPTPEQIQAEMTRRVQTIAQVQRGLVAQAGTQTATGPTTNQAPPATPGVTPLVPAAVQSLPPMPAAQTPEARAMTPQVEAIRQMATAQPDNPQYRQLATVATNAQAILGRFPGGRDQMPPVYRQEYDFAVQQLRDAAAEWDRRRAAAANAAATAAAPTAPGGNVPPVMPPLPSRVPSAGPSRGGARSY